MIFRELIRNQIICALIILLAIVVGALIKLDPPTAKDVIIQVITAICALVTGQLVERDKSKRSTDVSQTDSKTTTETLS